MRKRPEKLVPGGFARFADSGDKPGVMVFEIRLKVEEERDGKFVWFSGIDEYFAELANGESLEWRQKVIERMLYMAEQTIGKALGVRPQ